MGDNRHLYGFRWATSYNGGRTPIPIWLPVASAYNGSISGGSAIDINEGDPVVGLSDGTVAHAAGAETTAVAPYGIVVGFGKVWDGSLMQPVNKILNSSGAYGSNLTRQTKVAVVPIDQGYWEIDVDDNTTATTLAGYQAFVNENVNHILKTGSEPLADPMLHITGHATTNTLLFRIANISNSVENKDFSGKYVKLIVKANVAQMSWSSATGT